MRAEVRVRQEVAGLGTEWFRGEVDDGWLSDGWVVITDVERRVTMGTGPGSWERDDAEELWFPRESVARLRVLPEEAS